MEGAAQKSGAFSALDETQFYESNDRNSESTMTSYGGPLGASEASVTPRAAPASDLTTSTSGRVEGTKPSGGSSQSAALLEITVSDPVKQGDGVQAYVSYRVSTKTSLPQYRFPQFSVIRRFSDFIWLHDRLAEKNYGTIIPPLPEKNAMEKFRFSADFIEQRRRALDVFINRVAAHQMLRHSSDLQLFLEANEDVWAVETSRTATETTSMLKKKPRDFLNMFKSVQSSVTNVVLGKEAPEVVKDEEYESLKQYVLALEGHLAEARKQSERLVRRHKELATALGDFGEAVIHLGSCEGGRLGAAFTELGNRSDVLSTKSEKQAADLTLSFEQPLREYVRMVHSIKHVMADRAQALQSHQSLLAELEAKKQKLARVRSAQPAAPATKLAEVEREIQEGERKADVAKEKYNLIVERMRGEMARFQEEKTRDLGQVMRDFAASQARLANDTADVWRTLLPVIDAAKPAVATNAGAAAS
ncbi:SORTING NEXIN [Klebsormidium nitens]|uniref:SORTING NEXIN n=1 Tax=Klebsormidium nitens TaxID=105231 RepID=A0A1Y1HUS7_KLENI|nr:SORTING NEXIN [Klebsormidium nitens]|eukprot:GAQ82374.1 SORTING NEXIN [Klebsormidium nitens]